MTLLAEPEQDTRSPAERRRPRLWPVLVAAVAVAAGSIVWNLIAGPSALAVALMVAAGAVTLWAAWIGVRRPSLVAAPLAVCLVALGNPLALAGMSAGVIESAGLITARSDGFGLVFWQKYPGIAGWQAPDAPEPVDGVGMATTVQAAVRSVVTTTSEDFGLTWRVSPEQSGVAAIPNGYGGASWFTRVDSAVWKTTTDASAAQRTGIIEAARAAAQTLALGAETAAAGDPRTGDGSLTWSDADGVLTLAFAGADATLSYSGGPFLAALSTSEYQRAMAGFAGQQPPKPLYLPDIPTR